MKKASVLLIALSLFFQVGAQSTDEADNRETIRRMIDSYNAQDYKKMKKPWFWLGKLVVTEKKLEKEFGAFFKKYGKAAVDTIACRSAYDCVAKLRMEKDSSRRTFLRFVFTGSGKLQGFGFTYPPLIYPKKKTITLTDTEKNTKITGLIENRYRGDSLSRFNGSVVALDHGKIIFKEHYGFADFARQLPLNDSSLFELASCGKQFTAMAILLLARQGKLKYSDTVQKYIPGFPYAGITIEHLVRHTSGVPDYEKLLDKVWDKERFAGNDDVVKLLEIHKPRPVFRPGERFLYSNTGYVLLSVIIEKASGMSYSAYLDSAIFQPLGMKHTRVYNTRRSANEKIDNYAYGYVYSKGLKKYMLPDSLPAYRQVVYQDAITGDGTVNSCISDLIIWDKALRENELIPQQALDEAYRGSVLDNGMPVDYGYGVFLNGSNGSSERTVYHTGSWPGYLCVIIRFPDLQKAVVVLSNNTYGDFLNMADDISAVLLDQD
jgi:CubicO group peptidase (beta-lactamase class C family)